MTPPESPPSLLERAADLIENLACGATGEAWEVEEGTGDIISPTLSSNRVRRVVTGYDLEILPEDRAWIATLNPSVATPLVAWLRDTAEDLRVGPVENSSQQYALTLARTVLGES